MTLKVVGGDLFDVAAEALVNSEQSDFILSWDESTISGQIRRRWGNAIQSILDTETHGETLDPGTVLKTEIPNESRLIYHAGFHHPFEWLDPGDDEQQALHLEVIGRSITDVLRRTANDRVQSVAFPLIGCGRFELPPDLLAAQFFFQVLRHSEERLPGDPVVIWLVVPSQNLREIVLASFLRCLLDQPGSRDAPFDFRVPFLDEFDRRAIATRHQEWAAFLNTRLAELLTLFIFAHLAVTESPPVSPPDLLEEGRPIPFGAIRQKAGEIARGTRRRHGSGLSEWTSVFCDLLDPSSLGAVSLERINKDRNDIAHGRKHRPVCEIRADLHQFLEKYRLVLSKQPEPPRTSGLEPWIIPHASNPPDDCALFEQWSPRRYRYLLPLGGATISRSIP